MFSFCFSLRTFVVICSLNSVHSFGNIRIVFKKLSLERSVLSHPYYTSFPSFFHYGWLFWYGPFRHESLLLDFCTGPSVYNPSSNGDLYGMFFTISKKYNLTFVRLIVVLLYTLNFWVTISIYIPVLVLRDYDIAITHSVYKDCIFSFLFR